MQQGPAGIADVTRGVSILTYPHKFHCSLCLIQLIQGVQTSRSNDIYHLKTNTRRLASNTSVEILLSIDLKSNQGFNHDQLGQLLVPVQHYNEFGRDPAAEVP
jgi:hypothetical protein